MRIEAAARAELLRREISAKSDLALDEAKRSADTFLSRVKHISDKISSSSDAAAQQERKVAPSDLEVVLISDHRLQPRIRGVIQPALNYEELGLADTRSGKPREAWETLKQLAENGGILPSAALGPPRAALQISKIIARIRPWTDELQFRTGTMSQRSTATPGNSIAGDSIRHRPRHDLCAVKIFG